MGWRQADTQTIALNLARPGGRLLYPQIAWGGDGPGYVEAELQLYPALFAPLLRAAGPVEWPGQLVSLVTYSGAALFLGQVLARRYGPVPALLGAAAFLSTRAAVHLATSIQPGALQVLLFVVAWAAFLRFEGGDGPRWLVPFALAGAAAMLVKPGAAQIGIASFVLLAWRSRARLASPWVWLAWAAMAASLVAHLLFAREIYLEYGNTFGVLSGGDSKLPRAEHLLRPGLYVEAARIAVLWGVGAVGSACALLLALRGRLAPEAAALVPGAAVWTLLTLRYSSEETFGSHYSVLAGVIGAWAVAQAAHGLAGAGRRARVACAGLGLLVLVELASSAAVRRRHHEPDHGAACVISLAQAAGGLIPTGSLVVVRAATSAYDPYWKTPNNYQDPRPFYLTGTRGWVLGSDHDDPALLEAYVRRGAVAYLEPDSRYATPAIGRWLEANGRPLAATACGRALALSGRRAE
jgi:hypothetical protein